MTAKVKSSVSLVHSLLIFVDNDEFWTHADKLQIALPIVVKWNKKYHNVEKNSKIQSQNCRKCQNQYPNTQMQ